MSEMPRAALLRTGTIAIQARKLDFVRQGVDALALRRLISLLIFLCLVLPLGLVLAFMTPLGGVADETAHALRAESLSQGDIIAHRAPIRLADGSLRMAAGVDADPGLKQAMEVDAPGEIVTAQQQGISAAAQWQHRQSFAEITPLALYMPVFYVPAASAIAVLRAVGAEPAATLRGARLANFAVYAVFGILALLMARRGHAILLCALAFPMEVSLAASLNQDGLLVASVILAVALLTRGWGTADPWRTSPSWLVAAGLLGLVTLAKIPYAGLLLLLILPLRPFGQSTLQRVAIAVAAGLPGLLWAGYAMSHISLAWPPMPHYVPGPLWPGTGGVSFSSPDAAAQIKVLLADPWRIVTLTIHSILAKKSILIELVGVLGFLNVHLPYWFYAIWGAALLIGAAADCAGQPAAGWKPWDSAAVAMMLILTVVAIYMSQYLTWTRVGMTEVIGPSGRYLLPLVPALIFLLPANLPPRVRSAAIAASFLPIALASLIGLGIVPLHIHQVFYGR